jgi:hypothetical protein
MNLVGDGILTGEGVTEMTVKWELYLRGPEGDNTARLLATWEHSYLRNPDAKFDAVLYEEAKEIVGGGQKLDRLTLRITPTTGGPNAFFLPNGDGELTKGRIPHLDLPESR